MAVDASTVAALAIAPVLLTAGAAKLAAPSGARDSFGALAGWTSQVSNSVTVRLVAAIELAAGLLVALPATRTAGALVAIGFGVGFAALGIWGRLAGTQVGCGCFGAASAKPLGPRNVAIGAAVVILALVALTGTADGSAAGNLDVAALLSLLLTFALFRAQLPRQLLPITGMENRR